MPTCAKLTAISIIFYQTHIGGGLLKSHYFTDKNVHILQHFLITLVDGILVLDSKILVNLMACGIIIIMQLIRGFRSRSSDRTRN